MAQRPKIISPADAAGNVKIRRSCDARLEGMRWNRYSWWVFWKDLADYLLPRRYKWLITPNLQSRGSPINQYILDSTGTTSARNLASGMMSGITNPARPWFKLNIHRRDNTQTSPTSIWLAECERMLGLIFSESNFYNSMAVFYFDLVIFGTGVMLIYEDYDDVIRCYNPCAGEYFVDQDAKLKPNILAREFTLNISQVVDKFGVENCSPSVQALYQTPNGDLTREIIVCHLIEPNIGSTSYGIPEKFRYREVYWESGQSQEYILQKRGFYELPAIICRWDTVSNDAYGRSPGMDALPDVKQLQVEVKRKAQAIDKLVNPPMVADIQLKNQPASLTPGGVTYVSGMTTGKVGFAPVYTVNPPVKEIMEDLNEVRERIRDVFFNNLFMMISQFEPKSNVSATEIDARRSEQLVMLGPVLDRIYDEGIKPIIERVFNVASRAEIMPPAPEDIQGEPINIEFISMLKQAQSAAQTSGIERLLQIAGGLVGVDPGVMDNIDIDYSLDKYSSLLNNDPKLIRSPDQLAQIRAMRQQQQEQAQRQQMVDQAEQLASGAKTLSETQVGGGENALESMIGGMQ